MTTEEQTPKLGLPGQGISEADLLRIPLVQIEQQIAALAREITLCSSWVAGTTEEERVSAYRRAHALRIGHGRFKELYNWRKMKEQDAKGPE